MAQQSKAVPIVLKLGQDDSVKILWPKEKEAEKSSSSSSLPSPIVATLSPIEIRSLFPEHLLFDCKTPSRGRIYELTCPLIHDKIADGLSGIFQRISIRRSEMVKINDDFASAERTRQVEQERTLFRVGTRYNFPIPMLRTVSSLFHLVDQPEGKSLGEQIQPLNPEHRRTVTWKFGNHAGAASNSRLKLLMGQSLCLPNSIMRQDIENVLYDPKWFFWVSFKSNGLRFFFIVCTFYGQTMVALINRSGQVFLIKDLPVPKSLKTGCVWDGELVHLKDGRFAFLVFDCLMVSGIPCAEQVYLHRLQNASLAIDAWNASLSKMARPHGCSIELRVKPISPIASAYHFLVKNGPTVDYKRDGLIFTANEPCVTIGRCTQGEILKLKRGCDNTVEFKLSVRIGGSLSASTWLQKGMPCELIVLDASFPYGNGTIPWKDAGDERCAVVHLLGLNPSVSDIQSLIKPLGLTYRSGDARELAYQLHDKIAECRYDLVKKCWRVELLRRDKTLPNSKSTVIKTCQNIKENLSFGDVFPPGSISDADRQALLTWEGKNTDWDKHLHEDLKNENTEKDAQPQCLEDLADFHTLLGQCEREMNSKLPIGGLLKAIDFL